MMVERSCREEPPLGNQSPCSDEPPPETPQGMPKDLGQPKGDRQAQRPAPPPAGARGQAKREVDRCIYWSTRYASRV